MSQKLDGDLSRNWDRDLDRDLDGDLSERRSWAGILHERTSTNHKIISRLCKSRLKASLKIGVSALILADNR
jgi:hypothetical protein